MTTIPPDLLEQLTAALDPKNLGTCATYDIYRWMHKVALVGMNAHPQAMEESGELLAVAHIRAELVRRRVTPPYVFFDVGANAGEYSVMLKDWFPSAQVHAFEASAKAFGDLEANLTSRGLTDLTLNKFALSDTAGETILYASEAGSQCASLYVRQSAEIANAGAVQERVASTTLDLYCADAGIERIHFLKLDVEGHELSVFKGAERLLAAGAIDFVQFEFGACNIDSRTYFRDFWQLLSPHFTIKRVMRDGLVPIQAYNEVLEIFDWQNFLAERR